MQKKGLTMRQIRELMRLKFGDEKLSDRAIALRLGVARSTVQDYIARISASSTSEVELARFRRERSAYL